VRPWLHAALAACTLVLTTAPAAGRGCELVLAEHRSGRELARLPLDAALPSAQIAFTHSVLGTPVADQYVWRADDNGQWRAHLIEERFEGDGYGLPNAAGPGETLARDGDGWRLRLDRVVHPLVVLPLPSQQMRVVIGDRAAVLLGALSRASIAMHVAHCGPR
jgi:hypothetical protein